MAHVVVLGAGVVGLQSAIDLLKAEYTVTVVAAHLPGDESIEYTSPWAGADWRAQAALDDSETQKWDIETYDDWHRTIKAELHDPSRPKSGLKAYTFDYYFTKSPSETIWWAPYVHNFRALSPYVLPFSTYNAPLPDTEKITAGVQFTSIAVNVPRYLAYLSSTIKSLGGSIIRARIPPSSDVASAMESLSSIVSASCRPKPDAIINATGLLAKDLCNDKALFPIKGQTVLVKGEADRIRTRIRADGGSDYAIPRPGSGTTVLGGTREEGNWSDNPDDVVTERILNNCAKLAPELCTGSGGSFEILSIRVGLRPGRKGGPRVESEVVLGWKIVHAYGHAGAGYQNSIGIGRRVVELVRIMLGDASHHKAEPASKL